MANVRVDVDEEAASDAEEAAPEAVMPVSNACIFKTPSWGQDKPRRKIARWV